MQAPGCYRGHGWPTVQTRKAGLTTVTRRLLITGQVSTPNPHPFTVQGSTVKAKVMTDISEQLLTRKQFQQDPAYSTYYHMTLSLEATEFILFCGNYLNSYPSCKDLLMIIFCSTPFCPKITGWMNQASCFSSPCTESSPRVKFGPDPVIAFTNMGRSHTNVRHGDRWDPACIRPLQTCKWSYLGSFSPSFTL